MLEGSNMEIRRVSENERVGDFINIEFTNYATDSVWHLIMRSFVLSQKMTGKLLEL